MLSRMVSMVISFENRAGKRISSDQGAFGAIHFSFQHFVFKRKAHEKSIPRYGDNIVRDSILIAFDITIEESRRMQ